jgi:hypothetical protein
MPALVLGAIGVFLLFQGFDGGELTLNDQWQAGIGAIFMVATAICEVIREKGR